MANPTLPPVAPQTTNGAVIHSATGGPASADLGIAGRFAGGIITGLKTAFPLTQDTYNDEYMQPMVDVIYGFGLDITGDFEVHKRDITQGSDDPRIPFVAMGSLIDEAAIGAILTLSDLRGFATGTGTGPGTLYANGTKFIITDGSGTFERQKLRKDAFKLSFRRYATS